MLVKWFEVNSDSDRQVSQLPAYVAVQQHISQSGHADRCSPQQYHHQVDLLSENELHPC